MSVLLPIYNTQPEHLRECVGSVLRQTFSDFELLILNDSPANTQLDDIVASFKDKRIIYTKNERNIGISASRNKLLSMARGEYLAIMDHDDISLPKRFAEEVAYLDAHPEVGVCSCLADSFPKKGFPFRLPESDTFIRVLLMGTCSVLHPASMIRKSVLEENHVQYEEEYSPAEDYRLWLRLMKHTHFHNIQEVLFLYRMHSGNTSKLQELKMAVSTRELHLWARSEFPVLWQLYREITVRERVYKFLHIFPFLRIQEYRGKRKIYLFNHFPLYSVKTRERIETS